MPSDVIARFDPDWGAGLLGDKAHSMIFDNTKIKRVVPELLRDHPVPAGRARSHRLVRRRSRAAQGRPRVRRALRSAGRNLGASSARLVSTGFEAGPAHHSPRKTSGVLARQRRNSPRRSSCRVAAAERARSALSPALELRRVAAATADVR